MSKPFGMTRGGVAALALVVATLAAPVEAAPPASYRVGKVGTEIAYEVYRTSSAKRQLEIQFDIDQTPQELSTIWSLALVRRGNRWALPNGWWGGFTTYTELGTGEPWPTVFGLPATLPPCPHPTACTSMFSGQVRFTAKSAEPDYLSFFFQLTDASAVATIKTPGWRLRKTNAVRFRRVLADQVSTGVRSAAEFVERFTHASAPGGRYGSHALVNLPCDDFGHGQALLTGGIDEPATGDPRPNCEPLDWHKTWGEDWAFGPTTWRVTGDVVGAGRYHARLVVIDFPKP